MTTACIYILTVITHYTTYSTYTTSLGTQHTAQHTYQIALCHYPSQNSNKLSTDAKLHSIHALHVQHQHCLPSPMLHKQHTRFKLSSDCRPTLGFYVSSRCWAKSREIDNILPPLWQRINNVDIETNTSKLVVALAREQTQEAGTSDGSDSSPRPGQDGGHDWSELLPCRQQ